MVAILVVACVLLSACQSTNIEDLELDLEDDTLKRSLTIELVSLVGSGSNVIIHEKIERFQQEHPDIELTVRNIHNLADSLSPWIRGVEGRNGPPDIVELTPTQMKLFHHHGKLESLNLNEPKYQELVITSPDGYVLGVKSKINPLLVYYNKDTFLELGLEPPSGDWSWNHLDDAIVQLKAAQKNVYINTSRSILEWMTVNRYGGRITDLSGTVYSGFLDSDEAIQAAEWLAWVGTKKEDYRLRPSGPYQAYNPMPLDLMDGNMALAIDYAYRLQPTGTNHFEAIIRRNDGIGIAPLPGGAEVGNIALMNGLAIPTYAKNKDTAMELLRYLTEDGDAFFEDIANYTLRVNAKVEPIDPIRLALVLNEMKRSEPASLYMYEDQNHGSNRSHIPPIRAIQSGQSAKDALSSFAENIDMQFETFKEDMEYYSQCIKSNRDLCGWGW